MTKLAVSGISGGKRVPVATLVPSEAGGINDYARRIFSSYGFLRIAERVHRGETLSLPEIDLLLQRAALPVLMKLVALNAANNTTVDARPLALLPVSEWLQSQSVVEVIEIANSFISSGNIGNARILIDRIDAESCDRGLLQVVSSLHEKHPEAQIVGPSVDALKEQFLRAAPSATIHALLMQLKTAGFHALRASMSLDSLSVGIDCGLAEGVFTNLAVFRSPGELARELCRLHESISPGTVGVWVPGYETLTTPPPGTFDNHLLRTLSIGSIVLSNIPYRRASSRYVSIDGLSIAHLCGANEFGFGAVDVATSRELSLQPIKVLQDLDEMRMQ